MLCITLLARKYDNCERHRQNSQERTARVANERRNRIATSLIIKHVLQKNDVEPDENTPKEMMVPLEEVMSEQEDPAVMQMSPSSSSVHIRQVPRLKSDLVISDTDDDGTTMDSTRQPWICAICLVPYKVGDEICWTQNPACIHAFHHGCIEQWLSRRHDCPVCRAAYMYVPRSEEAPWSTLANRCLNAEDPIPLIETGPRVPDDVTSSHLEEGGLTYVDNTTGHDRRPTDEPLSSDTN